MATRSFIARYDRDTETYTAIYCHWDGYPEGVGLTLRDHYNVDEKVQFLLANGDISSLRETVVETVAESYKKQGDISADSRSFPYMSDLVEHYRKCWCEYGYIFRDGKWECFSLNVQTVNLYEMENANV